MDGEQVRSHLDGDLLIKTQRKVNKWAMKISREQQLSRDNSIKTLRWEHARHVQRTTKEPIWLSKCVIRDEIRAVTGTIPCRDI